MLATATITHALLSIRVLPDACFPAMVSRVDGVTHLVVDPRQSAHDCFRWSYENLDRDERNAMRAAFGIEPEGEGFAPDWMTDDDTPCFLYVPPALRTSTGRALQGGAELARRQKAGLITAEREAYQAELRSRATAPATRSASG